VHFLLQAGKITCRVKHLEHFKIIFRASHLVYCELSGRTLNKTQFYKKGILNSQAVRIRVKQNTNKYELKNVRMHLNMLFQDQLENLAEASTSTASTSSG
jgi:hypothetical protein